MRESEVSYIEGVVVVAVEVEPVAAPDFNHVGVSWKVNVMD